jgi:hypothetical protein
MAKSAERKMKTAKQAKNKGETTKKGQSKAADYVDHLLRLHKLQAGLLNELRKEVFEHGPRP